MGQPVAVTERPSSLSGVVRFELNRALTGMGHEHFDSAAEAFGPRPAAELARRLFDTGQVDAVHVYANIVTVELARGGTAAPLNDVVRNLYRYWYPGMTPASFDDEPTADDAPSSGPAPDADASPAGAALSAAAQRVPAHLLERSRAGRDRWKAKTG